MNGLIFTVDCTERTFHRIITASDQNALHYRLVYKVLTGEMHLVTDSTLPACAQFMREMESLLKIKSNGEDEGWYDMYHVLLDRLSGIKMLLEATA